MDSKTSFLPPPKNEPVAPIAVYMKELIIVRRSKFYVSTQKEELVEKIRKHTKEEPNNFHQTELGWILFISSKEESTSSIFFTSFIKSFNKVSIRSK